MIPREPGVIVDDRRKILIIGTLGAGKTTLAQDLVERTGYLYNSIDVCRVEYSDGTFDGEDAAWGHFLDACSDPIPAILEFSGLGPHVCEVRDALLSSGIPVSVIWLDLPLDKCIERASLRDKFVPAPFIWAPIEYSVPAIYSGIETAWDSVWSRELLFQTTRLKFPGNVSCPDVCSAVISVLFPCYC